MEYKKLTLKDLLSKKEEINNRKKETKEIYISSLGGTITVKKPDRQLCIDALEMPDDKGDMFLVYESVISPNLKDIQLHKEYGVVEPFEIVEKIFEPGEITSLAQELVKMAGYGNAVKIVDDIKK